ncbi:MAG: ImmA/IrrE family metallo-endopeptidase [Lachnospiraceae bacterium]|nr:ImmA/IrrE family metallo-endopeptidase [Lachnospiraceae bacterium]
MILLKRDIKKLVSYYVKKFDSTNPFEIADALGIIVQTGKLGFEGCYMFLKNHRCIFLNEDLSDRDKLFVMAHELGHAIMHRKDNCYFIRNQTLLLNSKKEIEANTFAVELLVPDNIVLEYQDYNIQQLSMLLGYDEKLLQLKFRQ